MLGIKKLSMTLVGSALLTLGTFATAQAASFTFSINPKATFLRTNNDPQAVESVPIDLASLGISGGDIISLEQLGDFSTGNGSEKPYPNWDYWSVMIGVFSASDILLPSYLQNRVQDAINAGEDVFTADARTPSLLTDIPEDFWINKTTIEVPTSVTHLFISTSDYLSSDNTDPDGDYGVRISIVSKAVSVPEPSTLLGLVGISAFAVSSLLKCKRQKKVLNSVGS